MDYLRESGVPDRGKSVLNPWAGTHAPDVPEKGEHLGWRGVSEGGNGWSSTAPRGWEGRSWRVCRPLPALGFYFEWDGSRGRLLNRGMTWSHLCVTRMTLSKEDTQMANLYVKRCPMSLIIRKVQVKSTTRYRLTPARMVAMERTRNMLASMWREGTPVHCWWGMGIGAATTKRV